ncbi:unnamed protein product [Caenorhabditis bovis]|uniref:Uncharacterized protein n=1 Tax=Caenorhabditis bovis TaxID=2654633 RepID=A0A8S1F728_9PELO|nr:unnamed protein product [Caenorhabditis bovis]
MPMIPDIVHREKSFSLFYESMILMFDEYLKTINVKYRHLFDLIKTDLRWESHKRSKLFHRLISKMIAIIDVDKWMEMVEYANYDGAILRIGLLEHVWNFYKLSKRDSNAFLSRDEIGQLENFRFFEKCFRLIWIGLRSFLDLESEFAVLNFLDEFFQHQQSSSFVEEIIVGDLISDDKRGMSSAIDTIRELLQPYVDGSNRVEEERRRNRNEPYSFRRHMEELDEMMKRWRQQNELEIRIRMYRDEYENRRENGRRDGRRG